MYEVSNRSVYEHETFSFSVERRNLNDLYLANLNFAREIALQNKEQTIADYGVLNGKLLKRKPLD